MIVIPFKQRPLWPTLARERDFKILKNVALTLMRKRRPVAEIRAALVAAFQTVGPLPRSAMRDAFAAALAEADGRKVERPW